MKNRIFLALLAAVVAATAWISVPPPQRASAQFFAQQQYAGSAGGTANAITLTVPNMGSLVTGVPIMFMPTNTNTGPTTININSIGPVNTRRPSSIGLVALSGSEITSGVLTTVVYDGTNINLVYPVDTRPIGSTIEHRAGSVPPGYLAEDGSAVSRATYAALFSVIGTTYGSGDGSTTFNLPDSRGTFLAALDDGANRITVAGSGCNATALTSTICGSQNQTLSLAQLPTGITSSGVNSISVLSVPTVQNSATGLSAQGGGALSIGGFLTQVYSTGNNNINVTSNNTSGSAHPIMPPASLVRRAIKF